MKLSDYISERQIIIGLDTGKKKEVLQGLLEVLANLKKITYSSKDTILAGLLAREKLGSTAIGQGIAIPHARLELVKKPLVVIGLSGKGLDFDSLDGEPVHIIFLILSPKELEGLHLKLLATISKLLRDKFFLERLKKARKIREIKELIKTQEERI